MKRIDYIVEPDSLRIYITDQTHRTAEFGSNGRDWTAPNGIILSSLSVPDYESDTHIYLRGSSREDDNRPIICPSESALIRVIEAFDAYNREFENYEEIDNRLEPPFESAVINEVTFTESPPYLVTSTYETAVRLVNEGNNPKKERLHKNSPCRECRGAVLCDNCKKKSREMISF